MQIPELLVGCTESLTAFCTDKSFLFGSFIEFTEFNKKENHYVFLYFYKNCSIIFFQSIELFITHQEKNYFYLTNK